MPFYRRLGDAVKGSANTSLGVATSRATQTAKAYLDRFQINGATEVVQADLNEIGVFGTPTILLVGRGGELMNSWVGKLSPTDESEILRLVAHG